MNYQAIKLYLKNAGNDYQVMQRALFVDFNLPTGNTCQLSMIIKGGRSQHYQNLFVCGREILVCGQKPKIQGMV